MINVAGKVCSSLLVVVLFSFSVFREEASVSLSDKIASLSSFSTSSNHVSRLDVAKLTSSSYSCLILVGFSFCSFVLVMVDLIFY